MPNLNKVFLMGNLTRDPELRVTPKGTPICQFGLAVNREWKDAGGEKQSETLFVDIEAWGKQGEVIAKYCTKGKPLHVEGRLKLDQWEDKTTHEKRSRIKVVLESFQFLGTKDSTPERTQGDHEPPTGSSRPSAPAKSAENLDEDVPF